MQGGQIGERTQGQDPHRPRGILQAFCEEVGGALGFGWLERRGKVYAGQFVGHATPFVREGPLTA